MTETLWLRGFGVFGTGILASLSPCVYPLLPITIGFLGNNSQSKSKLPVLLYTAGQTLTLFFIGVAAVALGETLGFSSQSREVQIGVGALLLLFAAWSAIGKTPSFLSRFSQTTPFATRGKLVGAFLLGASAALIASPCTSPILGGVLAMMATSTTYFEGLVLMALYSTGFSLLFLLVGLGTLRIKRLPKSGKWLQATHRLSTVLLVVAGLYYLTAPLWDRL
jgi:cytochrome c-type biogenesis protein